MNAFKTTLKLIALLICVSISSISIAGFSEKEYLTAFIVLFIGAIPSFFIIKSFYKKPQQTLKEAIQSKIEQKKVENPVIEKEVIKIETEQKKGEDQVTKEKPKATNKDAAIGCLIFIIIATVIIWAIYPKGESGLKIDAFVTAKSYVGQYLKAPATAQFPDYDKNFVQIIGKDSVQVSSYVDSQNGFGAMLRSYYVIQMYKKGDNWYCIYFILNDQRIK